MDKSPVINGSGDLANGDDHPLTSSSHATSSSTSTAHPDSGISSGAAQNVSVPSSSDRTLANDEILPPLPLKPSITIEFCDRCRWAPRATWIQTELFLTFPTPLIRSITLQPLNAPATGGRFRVWLDTGTADELVWDRKAEGGFPELKLLKQRMRNRVQPDMGLGHSDVHGTKGKQNAVTASDQVNGKVEAAE